jgi:hypothetical protein
MTFTVGSIVEQRYPGPTAEIARASARDRVAAFEAAGWVVHEERWVPDGAAAPDAADGRYGSTGGSLVVFFAAARDASLPESLRPAQVDVEPKARMSGYALRLGIGIIVFVIVLAILFSIGLPILGTLLGGSPKPFLRGG